MYNHTYQEQTKKKPLILNNKMKNDPPTLLIKDRKHKEIKDKSKQKQNQKHNYDYQKLKHKQFKPTYTHFNQQDHKKLPYSVNPVPVPQPTGKTHQLSFGTVRNTQNQINKFTAQKQVMQINFKIQNYGTQEAADKKCKKYEQKPSIISKTVNEKNQKYGNYKHQQKYTNYTNYKQEQKYTHFKQQERCTHIKPDQKYSKQKIERKQKFKKPLIQNVSPRNQNDNFLCDEQLDFKPVQKKNLALEKKISQKKITQPNYQQQNSYMNSQNTSILSNMPHTAIVQTHKSQQNYQNQINSKNQIKTVVKKDKKSQQLKQLKQFQAKEQQIDINFQHQMMLEINTQQVRYLMPSNYLDENQKYINWSVRAILMDWMRQLSYQYSLKRDTYHLALTLLDNYLAKKKNLNKQKAQVIGATTLFIASKLQELECRPSQDFADATQGICTAKDIKALQMDICKTVQFFLNPPTMYSLANRVMAQWDKYLSEVDYAIHHLCFQGKQKVFFKNLDEVSYKLFRQLMQYIDCAVLDIQTNDHKPLMLILSLIYLIIGLKLKNFQLDVVVYTFPKKSHYLMDQNNFWNDLFKNFVGSSFSIQLLQLLPTIQYTASYFNLTLTWQKPSIQKNQQDLQQMNLQEYCSYQTFNRHILKTVLNRFRGIVTTY